MNLFRRVLITTVLPLALTAQAADGLSENSTASSLSVGVPIAVSVMAPAYLLEESTEFAVTSVESTANGVIWILEQASEGASTAVEISFIAAEAALVSAGTLVTVTALSAGWILSEAGHAIAFIPNALGNELTYNERLSD